MSKKILAAMAVVAAVAASHAGSGDQCDPNRLTWDALYDSSITFASSPYTLTNDRIWKLAEMVWVDDGEKLVIEKGTQIRAVQNPGVPPGELGGEKTAALIVSRGGQIHAEGTVDSPIVFSPLTDDECATCNLGPGARGLWGGIIIAGKARTSVGEAYIEGISSETHPLKDGEYGGTDDADNSGVLKYVSIRHGGTKISTGSEINGLTLYAVGSGTTIRNIDIHANADDGLELFGGTVDVKYITATFCKDDLFDWDQGWRGRAQFLFGIANDVPYDDDQIASDHAFENDGLGGSGDTTLYSNPMVYNATMIGPGAGCLYSDHGGDAFRIREGAAGHYKNMVVMDYPDTWIKIDNTYAPPSNSRDKLVEGLLQVRDNVAWGFNTFASAQVVENNVLPYTTVADPNLRGISRTKGDPYLDPRPCLGGSPCWTGYAPTPSDTFWTSAPYRGAFGTENWMLNWTAVDDQDILARYVTFAQMKGKLNRRQSIDLTVYYSGPGTPTGGSVYVNGTPVTFGSVPSVFSLTCGGRMWQWRQLPVSALIPGLLQNGMNTVNAEVYVGSQTYKSDYNYHTWNVEQVN